MNKRGSTLLWIFLILIVAIVIVAAVFLFSGDSSSSASVSDSNNEVKLRELPPSQVIDAVDDANEGFQAFDVEMTNNHTIRYVAKNNASLYTYSTLTAFYDFTKKSARMDMVTTRDARELSPEEKLEVSRMHTEISEGKMTLSVNGVEVGTHSSEGAVFEQQTTNFFAETLLNGSTFTFEPDESLDGQSYYVLRVYNPEYVFKSTWGFSQDETPAQRQALAAKIKDNYVFKIWVNKKTLYVEKIYITAGGMLDQRDQGVWDSQRSNFNTFIVTYTIKNIQKA